MENKRNGILVIIIIVLIITIIIIITLLIIIWLANPYTIFEYVNGLIEADCLAQNQIDTENQRLYMREEGLTPRTIVSYCSAWATMHKLASDLNDDLILNFRAIKNEILAVVNKYKGLAMMDIDSTQHEVFFKTAVNWRVIWVKFFNQWGPAVNDMPTLHKIVAKHPKIVLLHISIMDPGTILPLHEGISKTVVRYHLPIQIPPGEVYLLLDGHKIEWIEGEGFVFDDCIEHGVVVEPDLNMKRIIIFADIPREFSGFFSSVKNYLSSFLHHSLQHNKQIEKIKKSIATHH